MDKCPKCNINIDSNSKFCFNCGCKITKSIVEKKLSNNKFCSECGFKLNSEYTFCPECGKKVFNDCLIENEKVVSPFIYEKHADGTYTITGLKDKRLVEYIIPEDVVSISSHAFEGCSAVSITLPNSLLLIEEYAFKNCTYLETINLSNNLKAIGKGAFENCKMLDISIPKTISKVGENAIKNTLTDKKNHCEIKAGSILKLGTYFINDSMNKESIEWLVLKKSHNKALLISKYGIEYSEYNKADGDITWETCDLRKWLNNDFLNSSFSETEKNMILNTVVHTNDNSYNKLYEYRTEGGNDTVDKIFLLSADEVEQKFKNVEKMKCYVTEYAKKYNYCRSNGSEYWWLRSPGYFQNQAVFVTDEGEVDYSGAVYNDILCIRPALWINIK